MLIFTFKLNYIYPKDADKLNTQNVSMSAKNYTIHLRDNKDIILCI